MICTCVDGSSVDVKYSNWQNNYPRTVTNENCVIVGRTNEWLTYPCYGLIKYICQS